jgi:uncharacterized membrane protein
MITYTKGVRSTASIAGHPIHPILIVFPIAFLIALLVTDIVYASTRVPFWAEASRWLALSGVVTAGLAAIFGIIDFLTIGRVRQQSAGWIHALGNVAALTIAIINTVLHWNTPISTILPVVITLSAITVILLGITGWFGGELSYRFGVGVDLGGATQEQSGADRMRRAA